jgi:RepB DNA-primase from phage plasmid
MSKQTAMSTVAFLKEVFHGQPGYVELRAIPVKRGMTKERRAFALTGKDVEDFIKKYGGRGSEYGVYFGVGKRIEPTDGKKANVAPLSVLWADVDTEKNGWNTDEVLRTIANVKGPLAPNMIVKSGGGLHLYWMLDAPCQSHSYVEALNRNLAHIFSGDNVHDVSRILRLPGSFNNKRKPALCEVVYCFHFERRDIEEVSDACHANSRVFTGQKWEKDTVVLKREGNAGEADPLDTYRTALAGGNRNVSKTLDTYWSDNVRHNAPRGYVGIHEAQLVTTARMHCAGSQPDAIIERVMKYTEERMLKDAPDEFAAWNLDDEKRVIRGMLDSFIPKWTVLKKEHRAQAKSARAENILLRTAKAG